jgi:ribosomal protein S18 acetylase RimI-like enzyme
MRTVVKEKGFHKCSLLVEGNNEAGIRFYERNDFEKVVYAEKPRAYFKVLNRFQED